MTAAPIKTVVNGGRGDNQVQPGVSVVICSYTDARWDALAAAVEALGSQTRRPLEVILSIDHNPALVERATQAFPRALVVRNDEHEGLSGARNTGIRHATGEVVAFLDDDAQPDPDWLETLASVFEDPEVVGAGGVALPDWVEGAPAAWLPAEMYWVVGCSYRGLPTQTGEIRNPIGANMAFRRATLRAVGGFTDGIGRIGAVPLGCEETELSIRARARTGGKVLHVPDARVRHQVTASRVTWRYFLSRCWAEGLSKSLVASRVGSGPALASERRYATRVVPRGIARNLGQAVRGDRGAAARAVAIAAGLAAASAGYVVGTLRRDRGSGHHHSQRPE
ncbi:MAG TPA: glycosyltransferase family 2 protein [Thermoleophilaceae bacterium]|nr:glycosyltransferase family 2 protein [Thermoleophilaceae bacterium]